MNDQERAREHKNRLDSISDIRQRFIRTKILPLLDDINNEQDVVKKFTKLENLKDIVKDYDTTKIHWSKRKREFKQAHPKIHQQIEYLQDEFKDLISGLSILGNMKSTSSKVLVRKLEAVVAMSSKTGSDRFKSHTATKYLGGAIATSDHNQSQQMDALLAIALASSEPTVNASANAAGVERALKSPVARKLFGTPKKAPPPPPPFPPPNASANAAGVERAPKSPVASKVVGTSKKPPPPPSASANVAGVDVGGNGPPNSPSPITIIVEYQGKKREMGIAVPRERHNSWELMTKATNKIILSTTTSEFLLSSQWVSFQVVINPELRKYVEWTVKGKMSSYGTFTMDHKGNNNADFVFMIPSKQDCISQKMACRIAPLLSVQNFVVHQTSSVNSTTSSEKCSGLAADHFKNSSGPMGSSLRITTRPLAKSSPNPAKRQRTGSLFKKGQPLNLAGFVTSSGGIPKVPKISFDQSVDVVEGDQRKTRKPYVKYDQTLLLKNKRAEADENSTLVDMLNQERKENENNSKKNRALVEILSNTPKRNDRKNLRPRTSFP
mmetsp:Transcript_42892/g.48373  ORF Transcript_42892/g.48373 Transcript_42892/m.48373 type:complete len:553 (-) Transcript_42892:43-1701(-)